MARRQISGNDILLFIDTTGGTLYELVVCLTSNSLERTTNEIDAASKCGQMLLAGTQQIKVNFEFADVLDLNTGEVSEDALHTAWAAKTVIGWKFGPATPVTDDVTYTGQGFISQLNTNAQQNNQVITSGVISVQGTITQTVSGS